MSKTKKVDDKPGESGNQALVHPARRTAAEAIIAAKQADDEHVGVALFAMRRADHDRRANML